MMRRSIKRLRLGLLASFIGCGAIFGLLVSHFWKSYEAQFTLPVDLVSFRASEGNLESVEELRRFGQASGQTQSPLFQRLERTMALGSRGAVSSLVRYEVALRFKKKDWRDTPDVILAQLAGKDNGTRGDAVVYGYGQQEDEARRLAMLAMGFLRQTYMAVGMRQQFYVWGASGKVELARLAESAARTQAQLISVDRKLALLSAIREKYKDLRELSPTVGTGVQVQVQNAKNLLPLQQAIGLEAERIELEEGLAEIKLQIAYHRYLTKLVDEFTPRLEGNEAPSVVASQMRERLLREEKPSDILTRLALERAQVALNVGLAELDSRWNGSKTEPDTPVVKVSGPRRLISVSAGIALATLLWLAVLLHRRVLVHFEHWVGDTPSYHDGKLRVADA